MERKRSVFKYNVDFSNQAPVLTGVKNAYDTV